MMNSIESTPLKDLNRNEFGGGGGGRLSLCSSPPHHQTTEPPKQQQNQHQHQQQTSSSVLPIPISAVLSAEADNSSPTNNIITGCSSTRPIMVSSSVSSSSMLTSNHQHDHASQLFPTPPTTLNRRPQQQTAASQNPFDNSNNIQPAAATLLTSRRMLSRSGQQGNKGSMSHRAAAATARAGTTDSISSNVLLEVKEATDDASAIADAGTGIIDRSVSMCAMITNPSAETRQKQLKTNEEEEEEKVTATSSSVIASKKKPVSERVKQTQAAVAAAAVTATGTGTGTDIIRTRVPKQQQQQQEDVPLPPPAAAGTAVTGTGTDMIRTQVQKQQQQQQQQQEDVPPPSRLSRHIPIREEMDMSIAAFNLQHQHHHHNNNHFSENNHSDYNNTNTNTTSMMMGAMNKNRSHHQGPGGSGHHHDSSSFSFLSSSASFLTAGGVGRSAAGGAAVVSMGAAATDLLRLRHQHPQPPSLRQQQQQQQQHPRPLSQQQMGGGGGNNNNNNNNNTSLLSPVLMNVSGIFPPARAAGSAVLDHSQHSYIHVGGGAAAGGGGTGGSSSSSSATAAAASSLSNLLVPEYHAHHGGATSTSNGTAASREPEQAYRDMLVRTLTPTGPAPCAPVAAVSAAALPHSSSQNTSFAVATAAASAARVDDKVAIEDNEAGELIHNESAIEQDGEEEDVDDDDDSAVQSPQNKHRRIKSNSSSSSTMLKQALHDISMAGGPSSVMTAQQQQQQQRLQQQQQLIGDRVLPIGSRSRAGSQHDFGGPQGGNGLLQSVAATAATSSSVAAATSVAMNTSKNNKMNHSLHMSQDGIGLGVPRGGGSRSNHPTPPPSPAAVAASASARPNPNGSNNNLLQQHSSNSFSLPGAGGVGGFRSRSNSFTCTIGAAAVPPPKASKYTLPPEVLASLSRNNSRSATPTTPVAAADTSANSFSHHLGTRSMGTTSAASGALSRANSFPSAPVATSSASMPTLPPSNSKSVLSRLTEVSAATNANATQGSSSQGGRVSMSSSGGFSLAISGNHHGRKHRVPPRIVASNPERVLDAPELPPDATQLLDWGENDVLMIGLKNVLYTWNAATAASDKVLELTENSTIRNVAWLQKCEWAAVSIEKGQTCVVDLERKQHIQSLYTPCQSLSRLAISGPVIAAGSDTKGHVYVYDVRAAQSLVATYDSGHRFGIRALQYCKAEPYYLASGCAEGTVCCWDARRPQQPRYGFSTIFSDGVAAAGGGGGNNASLVSSATGGNGTEAGGGGDATAVADGSGDIPSGFGNARSASETRKHLLDQRAAESRQGAVTALAWSAEQKSRLLVAGGPDHVLRQINTHAMDSRSIIEKSVVTGGSRIGHIISPNPYAGEVLTAHDGGYLELRRLHNLQLVGTYSAPSCTEPISCLTLAPDNQRVCAAQLDETLKFWKVFEDPAPKKRASEETKRARTPSTFDECLR